MTELWDRRSKQFLVLSGVVLLLFASLKFAKYFADILIIVGISILIAYLLIGPVDLLTKIVRFRAIAVMIVYLLIFSFIAGGFFFLGPKIGHEFKEFTKEIPQITSSIEKKVSNIQSNLNNYHIPVNLNSLTITLKKRFSTVTSDPMTNILGVAASTFHFMFYLLACAVISYYFLLDGHKIAHEFTKFIPNRYQGNIRQLLIELDKCLRGFYGGMVKLAFINATVMFTAYLTMKLPYALLLALWHFVSFIIPVVGGWIGLIPALLVIAFTSPIKIWIPIVVYEGFTRLIQDNLITPKIMGDAIGMHPVVVLIAVLAGLKTAGIIGIVFALPLFGAINVILKYSLEHLGEAEKT